MKALSLTQPWATLVAIGAKKIETRSWPTGFRGQFAIHASKGFPTECKALCNETVFADTLMAAGIQDWRDLPLGAILCTARLIDCTPMTETNISAIRSTLEYAFGDYAPGRYMWKLDNVKPLPEPIPYKGALGLWEWNQ